MCRCCTPATLQALVDGQVETGAAATVLTAVVADPPGYGRIVRDGRADFGDRRAQGCLAGASGRSGEINSGIYAFDLEPLFGALKQIGSANAQGEYYLPDLVRIYRDRGLTVETVTLDDPREIFGVNSRRELADVIGRY